MKRGFTLIELLVVILIIGILAAVALPQYEKAVIKARVTEAIVTLKAVTDAQEIYAMANGEYTNSLEDLDIQVQNPGKYFSYACSSKRTCVARPIIAGYPIIEFHMKQLLSAEAVSGYLGKHWCTVNTLPTANVAKAQSVCRSLGTEDNTMPAGYYYLLN